MPTLSAKTLWTYRGGDIENLPQGINPPILNRSYTITADVEIPDGGAEGVVVVAFDHLGGYSLFVMDNKLHHTYSFMGVQTYQHESDKPLPTGRLRLRLDFEADAPVMAPAGTVSLFANDEPIGSGRMDHTVPILFTAYAGLDNGEVVDIRYETRPPMPSPAPSTRSPTTSDPRAKPTTRRSTRPKPPAARPATSSPTEPVERNVPSMVKVRMGYTAPVANCPLPLTVQESPGRVRLCLGNLAHGDGPTLQDAADDLVQRLLTYVMALRATGIRPSLELAPPDLATMDFLYQLGEIAAAGGDIRSHLFD